MVTASADITFDLMVRHDGDVQSLATWAQHFDPQSGDHAQAYEVEKHAPTIEWSAGDQLVFRYSSDPTAPADAWIPNGDGMLYAGRIPNVSLPQ